MHDDEPPTKRSINPLDWPWPDYSTREPLIFELEETVQLCADCGDEIPSGHESCRCVNCREEYEQEKALAAALLESHR